MATTMKFRTKHTIDTSKYKSPSGEKTELRHRAIMHENGRRELVKDVTVNIYENIQVSREECEIERIIARAANGDYNALNAVNGTFMDITDAPSSIAEAQQYIMNAKNEFEKLPKEIKAKFEFNPEIYIAEMSTQTGTWLEKMGIADQIRENKAAVNSKAETDKNFALAMEKIANGKFITAGTETKGEINE